MKHFRLAFLGLAALLLAGACREGDYVVYSEDRDTGARSVKTEVVGMYLLNEGNMGSNKASLDFLDLSARDSTIHYIRNIYAERNPSVVKELGDVGNDIQIYGNRLWMVINCSNKVEVATVDGCRRLGQVNIPNCRYVAFDGGYAYVSSYVGPVEMSQKAPLGRVYKVDTLTLQKVDSITVGYQPEEMTIVDGRLYVANSGGYRKPLYDRTVSEIDLKSFRELRKIDVAINLHRCRADRYGQLWVTSRGDYYKAKPRLYWLRKGSDGQMAMVDSIDVAVSDMAIVGDSLYYIGVAFNYNTFTNDVSYGIVNVRTHEVVSRRLSDAAELARVEVPYGIMVHPTDKDFYIMDAHNYVSSGELLHFKADGSFDYKVWTGDIPGHAVFVRKTSNNNP